MLTHRNITDKYLRGEVAWVLWYFRSIVSQYSLINECRYLHYPIHSGLYVTYDFELKKVIEIQHKQFKQSEVEIIKLI